MAPRKVTTRSRLRSGHTYRITLTTGTVFEMEFRRRCANQSLWLDADRHYRDVDVRDIDTVEHVMAASR